MKRTTPIVERRLGRLRRLALGLSVLGGCAACISNPVEVDARGDSGAWTNSATVQIALRTDDDAQSGARPIPPALADELRTRTESRLRAKGYAIGSASESDLILELVPREETSARRTWTSDPDANGARVVQKQEASIALRARRSRDGAEFWSCVARERLAASQRAHAPSAREVWTRVLDESLARIPDRR